MHAGIDYQPHGSPHFEFQHAKSRIGIFIHPKLLPEAFTIKRPSLYISCVAFVFAELWYANHFLGKRDLQMMAWNCFMQGKNLQIPLGTTLKIAGVCKEPSRPSCFDRTAFVVGCGSGFFSVGWNRFHPICEVGYFSEKS